VRQQRNTSLVSHRTAFLRLMKAAAGSSKNMTPKLLSTTSKLPAWNGCTWASATSNVALATPTAAVSRRASATWIRDKSAPRAYPPRVARAARMVVSPQPHPMSRTFSPSSICAPASNRAVSRRGDGGVRLDRQMAVLAEQGVEDGPGISPALRGRPLRYTRLTRNYRPSWLLQLWVLHRFSGVHMALSRSGQGGDRHPDRSRTVDCRSRWPCGWHAVGVLRPCSSLVLRRGRSNGPDQNEARLSAWRSQLCVAASVSSSDARPQVHRPRQASRSHPRRLVPFSIRPPNEVHCARSGRCPFHTDIESERGRRQSRPGASNGPSVAAATRQDNDEEGAIRSQRRPTRRDAVETAESAVASTWAIGACGLRRRVVTASSCTSERATGRATAISSHRRSRRDNKAHISGGPVGVSEYQSVAPCGHSYTLGPCGRYGYVGARAMADERSGLS
jgi:hypothetical protein